MNILSLSTVDLGGGAERVAWQLFDAFRARGHRCRLSVGLRRGQDPDVVRIDNGRGRWLWPRLAWALEAFFHARIGQRRGALRLSRLLRRLAEPANLLSWWRGREPFEYPGVRRLLEEGGPWDLLHAHNLHGDYFDLRALPAFSRRLPVLLTPHDAWLLSGHCAHSFACERWQTGCGQCPDLSIPPAVRRDATAENWRAKRDLYAASRLYLGAPSRWLLDKVRRSMLAPALADARVIPYGIDLSLYRPGDQAAARQALGLPAEGRLLLFAAHAARRNPWKDYATLRAALAEIAAAYPGPLSLIALGDTAPPERAGRAEVRFVPFTRDPAQVARFYQAADLYLHPARADTFPNTVLEALACGTPVVATAVGGIPEQVEEGESGALAPPGDPAALAAATLRLLNDDDRRAQMGRHAAAVARRRYDLGRFIDDVWRWYGEALADWRVWRGAAYAEPL
jgi:glycosyltransferase involved in cell wall biosynthesis